MFVISLQLRLNSKLSSARNIHQRDQHNSLETFLSHLRQFKCQKENCAVAIAEKHDSNNHSKARPCSHPARRETVLCISKVRCFTPPSATVTPRSTFRFLHRHACHTLCFSESKTQLSKVKLASFCFGLLEAYSTLVFSLLLHENIATAILIIPIASAHPLFSGSTWTFLRLIGIPLA